MILLNLNVSCIWLSTCLLCSIKKTIYTLKNFPCPECAVFAWRHSSEATWAHTEGLQERQLWGSGGHQRGCTRPWYPRGWFGCTVFSSKGEKISDFDLHFCSIRGKKSNKMLSMFRLKTPDFILKFLLLSGCWVIYSPLWANWQSWKNWHLHLFLSAQRRRPTAICGAEGCESPTAYNNHQIT